MIINVKKASLITGFFIWGVQFRHLNILISPYRLTVSKGKRFKTLPSSSTSSL